jgi:hypothetical protein
MEQCLGGRNDEARGERKEVIATQAELKNFPGTLSWVTSRLEDVKKSILRFAVNSA